jgi:hypothetical protein
MGGCNTGCSIRTMKTEPNKIKTVSGQILMKAFMMTWGAVVEKRWFRLD